jgi:hypothetical protein
MQLVQVKLDQLSRLTHTVWVSEHERHGTPEFLVIKYCGIYRDGFDGSPDAKYILATAAAARAAWFSEVVVLDFTDLAYAWGDEMGWVFDITREPGLGCSSPLVVVVGDRSRDAIKTLIPEDYADVCRDDLTAAEELGRSKRAEYKAWLKAWRGKPPAADG